MSTTPTRPRTLATDCDVWLAVSDGLLYPLTKCCMASGKGSATPTGVCCRACYATVDPVFGDCIRLGQTGAAGRLAGWIEDITGGACPCPQDCATHTLWQVEGE